MDYKIDTFKIVFKETYNFLFFLLVINLFSLCYFQLIVYFFIFITLFIVKLFPCFWRRCAVNSLILTKFQDNDIQIWLTEFFKTYLFHFKVSNKSSLFSVLEYFFLSSYGRKTYMCIFLNIII